MNQTASSIRHELAEKQFAYTRLMQHPQIQAEAIARHYIAHAAIAHQILSLVEFCKAREGNDAAKQIIDFLVQDIKQNHRRDFGIDLDWPQQP